MIYYSCKEKKKTKRREIIMANASEATGVLEIIAKCNEKNLWNFRNH